MVEYLLHMEWHKELIIQEFKFATQGLTEIIEFYKHLDTTKEISQMLGERQHQNQNTNSPVNTTNASNSHIANIHTIPWNPSKRMLIKFKSY